MSIPYNELSSKDWVNILLNSNIQRGGALVGFRGTPFQRGHGLGSILKSIFRVAAPVAKKIFKNVAKEGISSAVQIGSDLLEGRNMKESVTEHSRAAGKRLLKKGVKSAKKRLQAGSGIGTSQTMSINRKKGLGYQRTSKKRRKIKSEPVDYLDF